MKWIHIVSMLIILASIVLSVLVYEQAPDMVASHWDAQGNVNGYMSKFWGLFLMPLVLLVLYGLFVFLPKIDPLKENVEKFRKYYDGFIVVFLLFMLLVHINVVLWNIGIYISPSFVIPLGIGLLFIYIGLLLKQAKRNWFIGIRTPWTMQNDTIWDKTHALAAPLFMISGILSLIGVFFPKYSFYFLIIPVLATVVVTIVYSYFISKK